MAPRRSWGAALAALMTVVVVSACGSEPADEQSMSSDASTTLPPVVTQTAAPPSQQVAQTYTIQNFIRDNGLTETAMHPGDPGAPTVNMPLPPGWVDAGPNTPQWAWSAMYLNDPALLADPPNIITIISKLTGPGDLTRALLYAPGELKGKREYRGTNGIPLRVSGFDGVQMEGTFVRDQDNVRRAIQQTTVLIPAPDGVFVMQMNADGDEAQIPALEEAMRVVNTQTVITP
ncbi:LpqN/LpqT family lipoprotein [Mycolicibacterium sp. F2034L]|uniref:LpqN/LpqT family lipoprotein n=1 Tax=Mycolicibacterium sp. F2034L TaxID=2926422 RepID=UPI001FF421BC|nr:LpqN/LpqT family lipoprotein [Mycolicibacterium sp. F2034L]MCK0172924.1 LpqN/LpqT family lipoprotein [Mycolicibacterium sp. F2034L]